MATNRNYDLDDVVERGTRSAKKKVKKLHAATKVLAVLFLIIGIAGGVLACTMLSQNDRFLLTGETQISLSAGTPYTYEEEGFEAVAFGLDCTAKVQVQASKGITVDANGNYVIPAEEGVYTLTYTVDSLKFNGKLGGEKIQRIRVFTVDAAEEDGRNG